MEGTRIMEDLKKGDILQVTLEVGDETAVNRLQALLVGCLGSDYPGFYGCHVVSVAENDDIDIELQRMLHESYKDMNASFNKMTQLLVSRTKHITTKVSLLREMRKKGVSIDSGILTAVEKSHVEETVHNINEEELAFAPEGMLKPHYNPDNKDIYVMVADDDEATHTATSLVLSKMQLPGYNIRVTHTYSANDTIAALQANEQEVAVVILDIVMESDDAGFKVVDFIRTRHINPDIRILVRSGQPGVRRREAEIVENYDVDGYLDKVELVAYRLRNHILTNMRGYIKTKHRFEEVISEHDALQYRE